jgi:hypothetical protein
MRPLYVVNNYGQFNHLILRSLRDMGIPAELVPNTTPPEDIAGGCRGVILGGGPTMERAGNCFRYLNLGLPVSYGRDDFQGVFIVRLRHFRDNPQKLCCLRIRVVFQQTTRLIHSQHPGPGRRGEQKNDHCHPYEKTSELSHCLITLLQF